MPIKTDFWGGAREWIYLLEADLYDPDNRNLLVHSEDMSNAAWVTENASIVASTRTDPEGTTNADKVTSGNVSLADNIHQVFAKHGNSPGYVARVTLQADVTVSPHNQCGLALLRDFDKVRKTISPGDIIIVSGPGQVLIDDGTIAEITGLSDTKWTEIEVNWGAADNNFTDSDFRLQMFPGGSAINAGINHIWRSHIEEEAAPNGLGFRSRGPRKTEADNGLSGKALGQAITVRAGTQGYITRPTDTYPGGSPAANNLHFREGLLSPFTIQVSGGGPGNLVEGIARTVLSDVSIANPDGSWDHETQLDWAGRDIRWFRGLPDAAFSTFEKIYEGTTGGIPYTLDDITVSLRDPLARLGKMLNLPKFSGHGMCVRGGGTGDFTLVDESPDAWLLGDLTVEGKVRFFTAPTAGAIFLSYGSGGETEPTNIVYSLQLNPTSDRLEFIHERGAGVDESVNSPNSSVPVADQSDGEWHDWAVSRKKGTKTVKLYWDKKVIGSGTYTSDATGGWDGFLRLGAGVTGGGSINGDLDEVRIWSVVRTDEEIATNADNPIEPSEFVDKGLRAYYRMDEGLETRTRDEMTHLTERLMNQTFASFTGVASSHIRIADHADLDPSGDWCFEVRCAVAGVEVTRRLLNKNSSYRLDNRSSDDKFIGLVFTTPANAFQSVASLNAYEIGQDGLVLVSTRWAAATNELAIFVEGKDKSAATFAGETIAASANDLFLAALAVASGNSRVWISELRIWNEAPSDATILARHNIVLAGNEANLKLWMTFEEIKPVEVIHKMEQAHGTAPPYLGTTVFDRQHAVVAKKDSATKTDATLINTHGDLQGNAHFVGTGLGQRDLMGKRMPYVAGLANNIPLELLDPLNHVWFGALGPIDDYMAIKEGGRKLMSQALTTEDDVYDFELVKSADAVWTLRQPTATRVWTNETANAADSAAHDGDLVILSPTPANGLGDDGLYIGHVNQFCGIDIWMFIALGLGGGLVELELSIQYWSGEAWEDLLGLVDGTDGFRIGGTLPHLSDHGARSGLRSDFIKIDKLNNFFNHVSKVRWDLPSTWVKESLADIDTKMGLTVANPSDTTDRWWIRLAATRFANHYGVAPTCSAVWVNELDAIYDKATGLIKFNSPSLFPPTADVKGDNTDGGTWKNTPALITKQVIDRWLPTAGFTFSAGFTTQGVDIVVGQYSGKKDITVADFLRPILKGTRTNLIGNREGDLALVVLATPGDLPATESLRDSQDHILSLRRIEGPLPASRVDFGYRPNFAKLGEDDLSLLLPFGERKDLLAELRWIRTSFGMENNPTLYLESELQEVRTLISEKSAARTIEQEAAEWASMLGDWSKFYEARIPLGAIEHQIFTIAQLFTTRFGLWDGISTTTRPLYILVYQDDAASESATLLLWG